MALQTFEWSGVGYSPLVFSHDWQTAILNWEPTDSIHEVERHNQSDEVFILWKGKAALIILEEDGLKIIEAEHGAVYNVLKGTWHTVLGNKESSWVIVENRDTHLYDTEMRNLSAHELGEFQAILPDWAK